MLMWGNFATENVVHVNEQPYNLWWKKRLKSSGQGPPSPEGSRGLEYTVKPRFTVHVGENRKCTVNRGARYISAFSHRVVKTSCSWSAISCHRQSAAPKSMLTHQYIMPKTAWSDPKLPFKSELNSTFWGDFYPSTVLILGGRIYGAGYIKY